MEMTDETIEKYATRISTKVMDYAEELTRDPDNWPQNTEMVQEVYRRLDAEEREFLCLTEINGLLRSVTEDLNEARAIGEQLVDLRTVVVLTAPPYGLS